MLKSEELLNRMAMILIMQDEGYEEEPYKCTTGHWTAGFGHNFDAYKAEPEPMKVGYALHVLKEDMKFAVNIASSIPGYENLSPVRQAVLINMAFAMGHRIKKFEKMLSAINSKDWTNAGYEIVNSTWAEQAPKRALRCREAMHLDELPDWFGIAGLEDQEMIDFYKEQWDTFRKVVINMRSPCKKTVNDKCRVQ